MAPYMPNAIRTRPHNLILALAKNGHEVTVLTLTQNDGEMVDAEVLGANGVRVFARPLSRTRALANSLAALASGEPLQAAYCWQPALADDLRRLLRDEMFDIVHVEHLRGSRYGLLAKSELTAAERTTPVIWDSVDCISYLFKQASIHSASRLRRMIMRLELPRTERFEGQMVGVFDSVLVTSPVDRETMIRLAVGQTAEGSIFVLSNGVDLDTFFPLPVSERDPNTIVVSGKMSYHANVAMVVHLVCEIMPRVWVKKPGVRLQIVGKDPSSEVRSLTKDPRISVTGEVDSMQRYLGRSTMAVAPVVYGAGIQNKVLEAMACATPVVASPAVLRGLMAEAGRHLVVADGPEETAAAIVDLLENKEGRDEIGRAGRLYVEENHDWNVIAGKLAQRYGDLIESTALATKCQGRSSQTSTEQDE